jgi:repressor LexA
MRLHLTPKQQILFEYLKKEMEAKGAVPSLRMIAADLSISHAAVARLLKVLEQKEYIKRQERYSRTIHILDPLGGTQGFQRQIPILGSITAGLPVYAQQEWDGTVVVDSSIYNHPHLFALRIQGDSMKNAGILDRDLAICTPRQYAENSEIVVALIDQEEATVKRFFLHKDHIELKPENPDYPSQRYDFDQVLVQGRVVGIVRGPEGIL